jgi:hypothetical protein
MLDYSNKLTFHCDRKHRDEFMINWKQNVERNGRDSRGNCFRLLRTERPTDGSTYRQPDNDDDDDDDGDDD